MHTQIVGPCDMRHRYLLDWVSVCETTLFVSLIVGSIGNPCTLNLLFFFLCACGPPQTMSASASAENTLPPFTAMVNGNKWDIETKPLHRFHGAATVVPMPDPPTRETMTQIVKEKTADLLSHDGDVFPCFPYPIGISLFVPCGGVGERAFRFAREEVDPAPYSTAGESVLSEWKLQHVHTIGFSNPKMKETSPIVIAEHVYAMPLGSMPVSTARDFAMCEGDGGLCAPLGLVLIRILG